MSLFVPSLISLFFFSGFVVAGIYAPDCSTTWRWVRMLSLPHSVLLALNRSGGYPTSHSILLGKTRVRLLRTCFRHVMRAVSCLHVCLHCVSAGREALSSFLFSSVHSPSAANGIPLFWPIRSSGHRLVSLQHHRIFTLKCM